jgi:multidrug efflux pump subunit AcrB
MDYQIMRPVVAWFVKNGVAANLLMILIISAGLTSYFLVPQEVFPKFDLGLLQVQVAYPGATPEEIEESILMKIEEQLEGLEGFSQISAVANDSAGIVLIELKRGEDATKRLDEVKAAIDRIDSFPDEARKPDVREVESTQKAIEIVVYGKAGERDIKELANSIKEDLTALSSVSLVNVSNVRNYEISIEVSQATLRALKLTLDDIADAVSRASLDLPGGNIETFSDDILVRTKGRRYSKKDFEEIVVLEGRAGAQVLLRDVAVVYDGFEDTELKSTYNGSASASVDVFRTGNEKLLTISKDVIKYVEEELKPSLPEGLEANIWRNDAVNLNDRLGLLLKNGGIGLLLVLITLTLFLDIRLAFWTAVGIFVAFVGTFAMMTPFGLTINLMTLFGFILSIGIVVDDAIVVGENIFAANEQGLDPQQAAIDGTSRVARPVIFAIITTIAVFVPLLYIPSTVGGFLASIPAIVISVLILSLIECLFILPRHLSHLKPLKMTWTNPLLSLFLGLQKTVAWMVEKFSQGPLRRSLQFSTERYGLVIASAVALLFFAFSFVSQGYIRFNFFPEVEDRFIVVTLELGEGAPIRQTELMTDRLVAAADKIAAEYSTEYDVGSVGVIQSTYVILGVAASGGGPGGATVSPSKSNAATVIVELSRPEVRDYSTSSFEKRWRKEFGSPANVQKVIYSSSVVGVGDAISVEVSAASREDLLEAVRQVEDGLKRIAGVFDVRNDQIGGRTQIDLTLKPEARTFGVTGQALARQIRSAFYGAEAGRVQKGREEVRIYVRLPENERDSYSDLLDYRVRTPRGDFIPLKTVADIVEGSGPSSIQRRDGRRIGTVTANVDYTSITETQAVALLRSDILPMVVENIPSAVFTFGGMQRQQGDALPGLLRNFVLALFAIYALLAVVFQSYVQPFVVMSAIPFAMIGAILGHVGMGMNLTMLSIFGIVGLSGVIINDSLVMIDFINEKKEGGLFMRDAIIEGAIGRFRPIFLTSITTFFGVFPLILERSLQAQFLVPVAISLGFGIIAGTFVLMFLVPALAMAQHDFGQIFARRSAEG